MELHSMDAHLTSDAMERVSRRDRHEGHQLQLVIGGGALVVLARGESAEAVLTALRSLLREVELKPVAIEEPPQQKTVEVVTRRQERR